MWRKASACARLQVPNPCSERDALMAATALLHGLTAVTRNTADFAATGVGLLNPWQTSIYQAIAVCVLLTIVRDVTPSLSHAMATTGTVTCFR